MILRKDVVVCLSPVCSGQRINAKAITAMHLFQDKGISGHRRFLATITFTQHGSAPSGIDQRLGFDNGLAC